VGNIGKIRNIGNRARANTKIWNIKRATNEPKRSEGEREEVRSERGNTEIK
jgi:hypothetical protein